MVSTYQGELLPGFYEDWILLERDRLAGVYERRMDTFLDELLRHDRWTDARDWAERWIAQGQIPEAAYRALMVAHAGSGEIPRVDATYQQCVEALQQELGVEPSVETQELYARLIAGEKDLTPSSQDMRDRTTASRLNLPVPPTAFIGRRDELKEARRLLANTRLLTITGAGGIGKTRLALQLARGISDHFSDGTHFVNLAEIDRASDLTQLVADAIDFPLSTDAAPDEQLLRFLRNKQLLLVMDNFEHVLDGAYLVSEILQTAPEVKTLATSRERLELKGEASLGVVGMSFPDTVGSVGSRRHDAIELFSSSARRVLPDFVPDAESLERVIHICRMVQGMPLAIELAAAWLHTLTLEEIESELKRSLDILSTEMRDVPDRHRSIRAAFDHSWSLAEAEERDAFIRLTVFRGGFTRSAALQIAGAPLEMLAALVGKSFVQHDPNNGRFEIHELLSQYGREKLESDPETSRSAHDAHAAFFAELMHSRWAHLQDARQLTALGEINADIENIRKAWRSSVRELDVSRMLRFMHSMRLVYTIRGWSYAGLELFSEAAMATADAQDGEELEALKGIATAYQGYFRALLGHAEQGIELARRGAEVLRRHSWPVELGLALDAVALCAQYLDLHAVQEQAAREAWEIAVDRKDKWMEAFSLFLLSASRIPQRDYVGARDHAERSLEISEELGDLYSSQYAHSMLGTAARKLGEHERAREHYMTSLRKSERLAYRWGIENASKYLGQVALALGEINEAEAHLHRSLRIAEEIGLGRDQLNILINYAGLRVAQGRQQEAIELLASVIRHPASSQARFAEGSIRRAAQDLLDELEGSVPSDAYAAALEQGKALDLDRAVAALVREQLPGA